MRLELITEEPEGNPKPYEFLFIHGLANAAWNWKENFMPFFAKEGVKSYAMSLRSHGKSYSKGKLNWHRLVDYLEDIVEVIERLDQKPILVGHSAGGALIQRLLRNTKVPGAVLFSSVPSMGVLPSAIRYAKKHPLPFFRTIMTMNLRPLIGTIDLYKEVMYANELPEEIFNDYYTRAQDESYRFFLDMLIPNRKGSNQGTVPMLVIGSSDDHLFTVREYEKTARKYGADLEIVDGIGHMMMLDIGWEEVARKILAWAEKEFPNG
jgi:pimeloyl-ACP methyl ester carboxylesterase